MITPIFAPNPAPLDESAIAFDLQNDRLPAITYHDFRIEFADCGEGLDGDFEPSNPDDIALLRADVTVRARDFATYHLVHNGSFCTMGVRKDAPAESLQAVLRAMMTRLVRAAGKSTFLNVQDVPSLSNECADLSYADSSDSKTWGLEDPAISIEFPA